MYLGIDLGTSSVKTVLINDDLNLIAQAQASLSVEQPHPLWSEQDPACWWQATQQTIANLRQSNASALKHLKAIGLSGQQHGATLLDKRGNVLRPAILWNDGRSYQQCQTLETAVPAFAEITGNLIMPGFTAPKLFWVKENEPGIFKQVAMVLLPKDYLRWRISNDFASDLSDASGTSWVNVAKRSYSNKMIQATGLAQQQLPKLFEGTEITGTVSTAIAQEWGIPQQTPIIAGAGDNAASAVSAGINKPGSAFLSLGTSGVYFVVNQHYQSNPFKGVHSFCHCLPGLWHQMTVHLSAAASLSWLATQLNLSVKTMMQHIDKKNKKVNKIIFLPYLSGERTPHIDSFARGVFFGLDQSTQPPDLIQAVLEGVAFAFLDGQNALTEAGVVIEEIDVLGGGSKNLYWGKILANTLQKSLAYRANREIGAALGAARLAWLGINKADPSTAFAQSAIEQIIEPALIEKNKIQEKYFIYRELYRRNKDLFAKLYKPR